MPFKKQINNKNKIYKTMSEDSEVYQAMNKARQLRRPLVFRFGKYKGLKYKTILSRDKQYIDWVLNQSWLSEKCKNEITSILK